MMDVKTYAGADLSRDYWYAKTPDETTPIDEEKPNMHVKHLRMHVDLPFKDEPNYKETALGSIRVIRSIIKNLDMKMTCYEDYVKVLVYRDKLGQSDDVGEVTRFRILLPYVNARTISIIEDLGFEIERIYRKKHTFMKRKDYTKIIL